ncbi:MAG: hypothetical protein JEZ09_08160 [Salinivirgaceae bacterium]|nr:hypothetical protein [Salinivirgaceae bacterium]
MEKSIREQINDLASKYHKDYGIEEGGFQDLIEAVLNSFDEATKKSISSDNPNPFQIELTNLMKQVSERQPK